jgi:cobalamin biosynthesis protein CobT
MNTAISILIDLSGSMGVEKTAIARRTTILLAETLTRINTPFEILGFSGDLSSAGRPSTEDRSRFARWGTLDMFYFKTFDENYGREQKERIAGMQAHAENYDGESVMFAAKRLQARPELKKILFVLSDGAPAASACDYGALRPHLTKVIKDLEKDPRLTVVGFGMLTDAPKKFYRHHVLVDNLEKFPEVLMSNLYKQLV